MLPESGATLAYSAPMSFTLWATWSARSGWLASQPGVDDGDGHALAGEPAARVAAAPIASRRPVSRYCDPLVRVHVVGEPGGDDRCARAPRPAHEGEGQVLHRLHLEAEPL